MNSTEKEEIIRLREMAERYRNMVYLAADAILGIDTDTGLIVEANAIAENITGFSQSELLKTKIWDLHPANEESEVKNLLDLVRQDGKTVTGQLNLKRKSNEEILVDISSSLIKFSNKKVIQNIYRVYDQGIAQRYKGTDIAGFFEHVLDSIPIGLGIIKYTDNSRQIEFENRALKQMFPEDEEKISGFKWYDKFSNNYEEKEFKGDGWHFEEKILPDNKVYLFISGYLLGDERNKWSEIRLIQDMTKQHIRDQQLIKTNQSLEKKLEQKTEELQEKQTQLIQSEKMASLGSLVAGVAHEINTPLGALKSNAEILDNVISNLLKWQNADRDKTNDSTENKSLKYLTKAASLNNINITAVERIISIADSLRNFARLDEAKLQLIDIHKGLKSSITLVQHQIKDRIEIITNFNDIPLIQCYPDLLNQVFVNILVNAIQSIEGRGKIFVETSIEAENVLVKIRDTGHGISKGNLEKIFDPGFTTKAAGVGTGLGLSIVNQIIAKHNASIKVKSNVGDGTTFMIYLPIN